MSTIAIFYGSTTGNTEAAAEKIKEQLCDATLINIDSGNVADMTSFDNIIIGTSTWGLGDLQDDWQDVIDELAELDLSGKKVAFFGTGDQESYSDTFVDAMGLLYVALLNSNAEFIGAWPTDGYDFEESKAVKNSHFVGLALDEDNQPEITDERIAAWVEQIKNDFV